MTFWAGHHNKCGCVFVMVFGVESNRILRFIPSYLLSVVVDVEAWAASAEWSGLNVSALLACTRRVVWPAELVEFSQPAMSRH